LTKIRLSVLDHCRAAKDTYVRGEFDPLTIRQNSNLEALLTQIGGDAAADMIP
jgi:hypothetical protein